MFTLKEKIGLVIYVLVILCILIFWILVLTALWKYITS
jgi:hypothetical protein